VLTLTVRFSGRGVILGLVIVFSLLAVCTFGVDAHAVIQDPPLVLGPVGLIGALSIFSWTFRRSDIEQRERARTDALTGLLNRSSLETQIQTFRTRASAERTSIGCILLDIDHFKRINDTYGHKAGDLVLTDIAHIVRSQLRGHDLAYRIGGEELLLLLPGASSALTLALAEAIRQEVVLATMDNLPRVTVTQGVAAVPAGEFFDYETLFSKVDAALYEGKQAGRNRVILASSSQKERRYGERRVSSGMEQIQPLQTEN
jgi:diguanylate cyclase (GGDEF)-like protein